jgi:hypothetical protein
MVLNLLLALVLPLLLLVAVLAMERWNATLPAWLQRLAQRPSLLWNGGIGLIIALSLLRWLMTRQR